MNSESKLEALNAYFDGELAPEERAEIENLISTDESLRNELEWLTATRKCLQVKCQDTIEVKGWEACQQRLQELAALEAKHEKPGFMGAIKNLWSGDADEGYNWVSKFGWAVAGVLAVVVIGGVLQSRVSGPNYIPDSEVKAIMSGVLPLSGLGGRAAEPGEQGLLNQQFEQSFGDARPSLDFRGYRVERMFPGEMHGVPALRVDIYGEGTTPLNLVIYRSSLFPDRIQPASPLMGLYHRYFASLGLNMVCWTDGDFSYMLLAAKPMTEILADQQKIAQ
ncbi:MAG: anti-sigma factor family protein [Fimbriimonadaceae bacterium]